MPKLNWDGNDFRTSQDSSGTVADNISRSGNLQQGYNHGSLTRGLVAYYPMEKGAGTVLQDGALDNLGQIEGPNWSSNSPFETSSLEFNGSSDYIKGPNGAEKRLLSEEITVSFWVYGNTVSGTQTAANLWSSNRGFQFDWTRSDQTSFFIGDSSSLSRATLSSQPATDQWHHLVGIYDGSKIKLYLNYDEEQSETSHTGFNTSPNTDLELGRYTENQSNHFNGFISDFRLYNRAISEPEIKALYNLSRLSGVKRTESSLPGIDDGGVSHWKLDNENNDANLAKDSWGDNNGTINGASYSSDSVFGNSLRFDSGSDYVTTSYNGPVDGGSFSIGSWVKSDDLSTNRHYLGPYDHGTKKGFWLESYTGSSNGNWRFGIGTDGNYTVVDASQPLNAGDWYHVYGTYDGSVMRLYVNGKLEAKASTSYVQGPQLRMGHIDPDNFSPLIGNLEDVRTYNCALSPLEIERLYHKGAYRINREGTLQ